MGIIEGLKLIIDEAKRNPFELVMISNDEQCEKWYKVFRKIKIKAVSWNEMCNVDLKSKWVKKIMNIC